MKLLIAGGGTGGHVFPAIAVADELLSRGDGSEVLFVGTKRGFEAKAVVAAGHNIEFVQVAGLNRVSKRAQLRSLALLPGALRSSWGILTKFAPDVVLGVGGYASGPLVLGAWLRTLPSAICEQNSIPGLTNRILGRIVDEVYGSFETSRDYFNANAFRLLGNPIRALLMTQVRVPSVDKRVRILVLGGSQGARPLNQKLPQAFAQAIANGAALSIVHQAGLGDADEVRAAYARLGVDAEVRAFIDDMASAYAHTDLAVARAGATTCAELTALGIPSLLIPFPQAADDHQSINASVLAEAGAALVIPQRELEEDGLIQELSRLCQPGLDHLAQMSAAARSYGRPHAARDVVDALASLCKSGGRN
jgi:UDP-N-acetylglucosamine--N-acetylmuramyl-(pentapeptide) pyrophosphoryl-undecaprenol N-acetylglucosamine transferase